MVQLIKKGGLRERANRSRTYQGSENTEKTLKPNSYVQTSKKDERQTTIAESEQTHLSDKTQSID